MVIRYLLFGCEKCGKRLFLDDTDDYSKAMANRNYLYLTNPKSKYKGGMYVCKDCFKNRRELLK